MKTEREALIEAISTADRKANGSVVYIDDDGYHYVTSGIMSNGLNVVYWFSSFNDAADMAGWNGYSKISADEIADFLLSMR